jgi:Peptidase M50B-like
MDTTSITDVWNRVVGTQPDPPRWLVVATALVALAVILPDGFWRISRNVVTIAHEGGHGLVALLTGRRLEGIRLHSDTSGLTVSRGKPTGLGMILTAAAGYTAPPLLGLGGAWLLASGHITALLWTGIALLAAMLVVIRNAYGVLSVTATGAAFFLVSWLTAPRVQAAFAYTAVWFLLLAGARPVVELQRKRSRRPAHPPAGWWHQPGGHGRGGAPDSDADQLGRLTNVPGGMWVTLFAAVALFSLLGGGRWLLGR